MFSDKWKLRELTTNRAALTRNVKVSSSGE